MRWAGAIVLAVACAVRADFQPVVNATRYQECLADVPSCSALQLEYSSISGSIPEAIGALTALARLDISYNHLVGTLPTELGLLTALTRLNLQSNQLGGTLDDVPWPNFQHMQYIDLFSNAFNGTVPSSIAQMTALRSFYTVGNDELDCTLPTELGTLTSFYIQIDDACTDSS